jgi:hypothetical protein
MEWSEITRAERAGTLSPLDPPPVASPDLRPPMPKTYAKAWGLGGSSSLWLPKKRGDYTIVGFFDLHGEWREPDLFSAGLEVLKDLEPDLTVLGGDGRNYDLISRWQSSVLKKKTPLELLEAIEGETFEYNRGVLARVRAALKSGLLVECEGNHDDRLRKFLDDDLHKAWRVSMEFMRVDEWLDGYYTRAGVVIQDNLHVSHGVKLSKYPAAAEYADSKLSGWTGHGHNIDQYYERPWPERGVWHEHTRAPAMCRLDANYGHGNAGLMRWHQGIVVCTMDAKRPEIHHTDIGLWNGEYLLLRGKRYYPGTGVCV